MSTKKLKFLFIVQGEGRGHMTQSIALQDLILKAGHELVSVLVGKNPRREIPSFYYQKIKAPIQSFESPNFILDQNNKSINVASTIKYNLKNNKVFLQNLEEINQQVTKHKPDIIINFYDLLCGLYFLLYKPNNVKHITIAHQYLLPHAEFETPHGKWRDKYLMRINNKITSFGAHKRLALSFREMSNLSHIDTYIVPPLLREEIKHLLVEEHNFILSYVLNDGYSTEIISWHENNKDIEIHGFWDRKGVDDEYSPHENIIFHKLNDQKFLDYMRRCKGYASSAGFESICEAMYLGKPVMLVPTGGHFEQECNAIDAVKAGAGIANDTFNLQILFDYLPRHVSQLKVFRKWADQADEMFLRHLEKD